MLSGDGFLEAAVARWDRVHDPRDSALRDGNTVGIEGRVRHMQAMRLGRPFTAAIDRGESLPSPLAGTRQAGLRLVALKGHFIAYVRERNGVPNEVILRDLVSGATICKRGVGREGIMAIALTSKVLAFVSFDAKLNVYKVSREEAAEVIRLQLPSTNICALEGDEDTIVLLSTTGGNQIITYSAHTGNLSSGFFDSQRAVDSHGPGALVARSLLVNESEGIVDVFSSTSMGELPGKRGHHIGHLRFSIPLHTGMRAVPISEALVKLGGPVLSSVAGEGLVVMGQIQPVGVSCIFRLDMVPVSTDGRIFRGKGSTLGYEVFFDTKLAKLTTENLSCLVYPQLRWKDVRIDCHNISYIGFERSIESRWAFAVGTHGMSPPPGHIQCTDFNWEREHEVPFATALVNDSFLVLFQHFHPMNKHNSIILIFCFDETVEMAHGSSTGFWGDTVAARAYDEVTEEAMEESHQRRKMVYIFNTGIDGPRTLPYRKASITG